jgi:hypothetical protein
VAIPLSAQEGKKYGKLYLKEYQAKNADEAGIMKTLMQLEGAFNSHDLEKFVSSFAKDAVYRPCGSSANPIASKECRDTIKYNFGAFKYENYYDPEISVEGDTATVKMLLKSGGWLAGYTAWLKKVGEAWLITKNDYTNEQYKGIEDF